MALPLPRLTMSVRAVYISDNSFLGVVSVNARARTTSLEGLCAGFITEGEHVFLDTDNLFIYGDRKVMDTNYIKADPSGQNGIDISQYVDKVSSANYKTQKESYFIPLKDILSEVGMATTRRELISRVAGDVRRQLPGMLDDLDCIDIDTESKSSMRGYHYSFSKFPDYLRQAALIRNQYYSGKLTLRNRSWPNNEDVRHKLTEDQLEEIGELKTLLKLVEVNN